MRPNWHGGAHWLLGWLAALCGFIGTIFGAALKAPIDSWSGHWPLAGSILRAIQDVAWIVIPSTVLLATLALWLRERLKPPWFWAMLTYLLDRLRSQAFHDRVAGEPEHHHRVTLFRYRRWHFCLRPWPWQGWLTAIKRSGHLTQGARIAFRATDKGQCEGIAGRTWTLDQVHAVDGLAKLGAKTSERRLAVYAERTGVSVKWIRKHWEDAQARSFVGIPIKVGGKRWGVVVLDSRSPSPIPIMASTLYPELVPLLNTLLSRSTNE